MEINELELLERVYRVREHDDTDEDWKLLFPEVIQLESSSGINNSSEQNIVYQNHLRADLASTSNDHDPGVAFVNPCSSSLIPSQDFYQENQSTLGDDKIVEDNEPYRIPSSVFDRSDSSAPAEWSMASNESLFSLHGGVSFGREESNKSVADELAKLDELPSNPSSTSDEAEEGLEEDDAKEREEPDKPPSALMGSSVSCRSDASDCSTFSFAFPILAPGRLQNSSTKGVVSSPNTSNSREPHSQQQQPDNYMTTPTQPASKRSCFSICCFPSFCSCSSCSYSL